MSVDIHRLINLLRLTIMCHKSCDRMEICVSLFLVFELVPNRT